MPVSPEVLAKYKAARRADPLVSASTAYQAAKWRPKYKFQFHEAEGIEVDGFAVIVELIPDPEPIELNDLMRYPTQDELIYPDNSDGVYTYLRRPDGQQFNDGRVLIDSDHLLLPYDEGNTFGDLKDHFSKMLNRHDAHLRAMECLRDRADYIDKVLRGYIVNQMLKVTARWKRVELGRSIMGGIEIGNGPHDLDYLNEVVADAIADAVAEARERLEEMRA